nr:MAG TPA_asm: hypothetical protein [Caudoviricetes sp.]
MLRRMPSAAGERQMLPRHTNRILVLFSMAAKIRKIVESGGSHRHMKRPAARPGAVASSLPVQECERSEQ